MARWAKLLVMCQIFISLSIVVLLISRAVVFCKAYRQDRTIPWLTKCSEDWRPGFFYRYSLPLRMLFSCFGRKNQVDWEVTRIVSLLPAATEIAAALGLMDQVVGVSHECDFPEGVNPRPRITHCPVHNAGLTSGEVDQWVRRALCDNGTIYRSRLDVSRSLLTKCNSHPKIVRCVRRRLWHGCATRRDFARPSQTGSEPRTNKPLGCIR